MHLRNVEIFCDVVEHRGFSKAADARQISQPAVSQALQQLEDHLGVVLIDRSKRPLELTAAGIVLYERCRGWLDELQEIEDAVRQFGDKVAGRVRVASIYSVGLLQMQVHAREFREQYPEVVLQLDYAPPDEVYNRVLRDEADLGIVSFPRDGGDIACIEWLAQQMVVTFPPEHRFAELPSLDISELSDEPFVAFSSDLTIRRETDKLLRRHHVQVNICHQFDNIENVKRAVETGVGIAILPLPTLKRELEFGTLRVSALRNIEFHRPLGIVHKRHRHLSQAAEKFVELLHEDAHAESLTPMLESAGESHC